MLALSFFDSISRNSFLLGVACGLFVWGLWVLVRLLIDAKVTRASGDVFSYDLNSPQDQAAKELVDACKKRLRFQKRLNPDWLGPLIEEVPPLMTAIAACYYPDAENPLMAPGLSQFSRAIHRASKDVSHFLENRRVGRLIDVSASRAIKTWETSRDWATNDKMQTANKWYKRVRPFMQAIAYNSPFMWGSVVTRNIAIRALQPAIVGLIARRAIELYSGRIPDDDFGEPLSEEEILNEELQQAKAAEQVDTDE